MHIAQQPHQGCECAWAPFVSAKLNGRFWREAAIHQTVAIERSKIEWRTRHDSNM
jgi:hypothetical protein